MNAANLKTSERPQRVDKFLSDRQPHSTLEIIQGAGVCAVNSIIAELRASGRQINCNREGNVWSYRRVI
jgi:hypothetical protein